MQAITCVISQYVENSSIVYVIEILRRCEGRHLLQEIQYEKKLIIFGLKNVLYVMDKED